MGNQSSSSFMKANFEDVQAAIRDPSSFLIINTLPEGEQSCLIRNTMNAKQEEALINQLLEQGGGENKKIIVYGRNCHDDSVHKKYSQLVSLGFSHVFVYLGGMFEWLLLQDIYGPTEFPTTAKQLDILKFRPPPSRLHMRLLL